MEYITVYTVLVLYYSQLVNFPATVINSVWRIDRKRSENQTKLAEQS